MEEKQSRLREWRVSEGSILNQIIEKGLEMIFEQSSEWKKEMGHENILVKGIPGWGGQHIASTWGKGVLGLFRKQPGAKSGLGAASNG